VKPATTTLTRKIVRDAIFAAIREHGAGGDRPLTLPSIAADLHCSRSTIQRVLSSGGTTYTEELFKARRALAAMAIGDGGSASQAARRVGLTPDHLRVLLIKRFGIGPAGLQRCLRTERLLRSWTRHPPAAHTRLYRARLGAWKGRRAQLQLYLDAIPAKSPLRGWADRLLAASTRPDFRTREHRSTKGEERRRHRDQFNVEVHRGLYPEDHE
jgi:AraC-like DNA-binding protein